MPFVWFRFSEKLTKYTCLFKRETILNKSNSSNNWRAQLCSTSALRHFASTHPAADMEQRDHSRTRSNLISFVVLMAALYVILVTVFIATLYHFTVRQSARIRTLELIAGDLAARVHKLETSFTAQGPDEKPVGETNREVQETTEKRLKNKVT